MISRKLAGAGAVSVGAATAVAALLLGTVSGTAADDPASSAYGLAVRGLVDVPPTPRVVAPPDGEKALLELPSPLGVGVLTVEAAGNTSAATAVDLNIADLLVAQVIEATCDNGAGEVSILGGEIAGTALPEDPAVGEGLNLSPVATVQINRQTDNDDGTLTVDALVVKVLPGGQVPDLPVTPQMLDQLRILAPDLQVPTIEDLQNTPPVPAPPVPAPPVPAPPVPAPPVPAPPVPAPPVPAPPTPDVPTLEDLLAQLAELNPGLDVPVGEGDALLELVVSSATCGVGKAVTEAPVPKPVETELPVTH